MTGSHGSSISKGVLRRFFLSHIGDYVRTIHFRKQLKGLPLRQFRYVLDAGCGDGHHAFLLAGLFPHLYITGMDITAPDPQKDRLSPNVLLIRGDLCELTADLHKYDLVYSIDVMEHIPGNEEVMLRIYSVLNPGGYFYLHMPNRVQKRNILPEAFLKEFHEWEDKEHVGTSYTLRELVSTLEKVGFEIAETRHTFGLPGRIAWEIDRATDRNMILKALLMPFLKILARISIVIHPQHGDLMVLSRKPEAVR